MGVDKSKKSLTATENRGKKVKTKKPVNKTGNKAGTKKAGTKKTDALSGKQSAHLLSHLRALVPKDAVVQRPERAEIGKSLRQRVPRDVHGDWKPPADRLDPISILQEQALTRVPELVPIRHARMATSEFAFFRGAAAVMAADLYETPNSGIMLQTCGDAHLVNFGMFATPERRLVFDVNDFDETIPGPWEWDVKRLAASIVVAGRSNGFSRDENTQAVLDTLETYRERLDHLATMRTLDVWYEQVDVDKFLSQIEEFDKSTKVADSIKSAAAKAQTHDTTRAVSKLTAMVDGQRRIVDHPPLIDHVGLATAEEQIQLLFQGYMSTLAPELVILMSRFRLVDIARKVVGVGSVGTRCWIALFEGGADDDPIMLQIKEAQPSVLEKYLNLNSIYQNQGERVVHGQRMMQSASDLFLGWSRNPTVGVDYYFRQLHDMKSSADVPSMGPVQLSNYGRLCGWTLARAHAKSGDPAMLSGYLGSGSEFDHAMANFAQSYADQNTLDFAAMTEAVASGRIESFEAV
ncbi:MAG: DUF2252 domain-containing protein [Actinomycetes bacterium]